MLIYDLQNINLNTYPKKEFEFIQPTKVWKVPSVQLITSITKTSNDELSGKLFADESLKNGEI